MVLFRALRRMMQPFTYRLQSLDMGVDLISFVQENLTIDLRADQHGANFFQREASSLAEGNQRQSIEHIRSKLTALTMPCRRLEQPLLVVIAKGRSGDSAALGNVGNVHRYLLR